MYLFLMQKVKITKTKRLYFHTALKYGAVRIAIKLDKIRLENIHFSLLFGGGAKYSAGEDVIFITDCIKKRLKVYSIPINIGTVEQKESTWFNGYTDKVFIDRGIYYTCLSKTWAIPLCIQYAIRHYKLFCKEKTRKEALNLMLQGVKQAKRMKK